jgi:hypothetical protein
MRCRQENGQAILLVVVACGLVLIGALGLAIDTAQFYGHQRMAQTAADAAAQAGIMSIFDGTNATGANPFGTGSPPSSFTCTTSDGRSPCVYARNNGFGGLATDHVVIDFPTAASVGIDATVLSSSDPVSLLRATVTRPVPTGLMRLFGASSSTTIKAVGVAAIVAVQAPVPLIVLHPTLLGSFFINGTPTITICGGPSQSIQVNSNNSTAVQLKGGSNTVDLSHAGPLDPGNCSTGTGADFGNWANSAPGQPTYPGGTCQTGCTGLEYGSTGNYRQPSSPIKDPLLSVPAPTDPGVPGTQTTINNGATPTSWGCPAFTTCIHFTPGKFTGGITVKNALAYFDPGLYYIPNGGFTMDSNSGAQMSTGVGGTGDFSNGGMLVFNSGGTKNDLINFTSNAGSKGPITLVGSDQGGTYKNILFFEDRTSAAHIGSGPNPGHTLQGGGNLSLTGTIYMTNTAATMSSDPSHYQNLSLQGNPGSTTTIIGEIIVDTLSLGGTGGIKMNLNPAAFNKIRQVALVH